MTKPIMPHEVTQESLNRMPDAIIEAWNELIAEKWDGDSALIFLYEAKDRLCFVCGYKGIEYSSKYLNIEDIYRDAGWDVEFEKPGYNESGNAYYEFSK